MRADILPAERRAAGRGLGAHAADQPHVTLGGERKDRHEVGAVEGDVELMIGGEATGRDVGDVEEVAVSSAAEVGAKRVPYRGAGTVTAGEVCCLAGLIAAACVGEPGHDVLRASI